MSWVTPPHRISRNDPRMVSLAVKPSKPYGSLRGELRFGREIAELLGIEHGDRVNLRIGTGDDAGRIELSEGDHYRVVKRRACYEIHPSGYLFSRVPFRARRLDVILLEPGRVVVGIRRQA